MQSPSENSKWFVEQVKPHEPVLRGYLQNRFPSLQDHDDVVQEAYSRILRRENRASISSIKSFLFKVARNVAIDMLRRRQVVTHETICDNSKLPVLNESPSVAEVMDQKQRQAVLVAAISALPERCREVVMLRHLDGLSYKEIAARLGISLNTVKIHMVKGMKQCTAYFRDHGILDDFPTQSKAVQAPSLSHETTSR